MGRYWWKAWVIGLVSLAAAFVVWWHGGHTDQERYDATVRYMRAMGRHREHASCLAQAQFCSGVLYWRVRWILHGLREEQREEARRPLQAKAARLARIELPVEVPAEPQAREPVDSH